jgi:hypothetical protein
VVQTHREVFDANEIAREDFLQVRRHDGRGHVLQNVIPLCFELEQVALHNWQTGNVIQTKHQLGVVSGTLPSSYLSNRALRSDFSWVITSLSCLE